MQLEASAMAWMVTVVEFVAVAQTLRRMREVLGWADVSDEDLKVPSAELNIYAKRLQNVPQKVRQFLGTVAVRAYKMRKTNAVQASSPDVKGHKNPL